MPIVAWFPPPLCCGAGWVIGDKQRVLQPPQPLSLSLKHAVLLVPKGGFSLMPWVKSCSNRRGMCYARKCLCGQNVLMFPSWIVLPFCHLLLFFGRVYGAVHDVGNSVLVQK